MDSIRFTVEIDFSESVPQDDDSILSLAKSIADNLRKAAQDYELGIEGFEAGVENIRVTPAYLQQSINA